MRYLKKGGVGGRSLCPPPSLGHFRAYLKIANRHFPKIYQTLMVSYSKMLLTKFYFFHLLLVRQCTPCRVGVTNTTDLVGRKEPPPPPCVIGQGLSSVVEGYWSLQGQTSWCHCAPTLLSVVCLLFIGVDQHSHNK